MMVPDLMSNQNNPQTTSQMSGGNTGGGMMRLTQRGADSFSQNSKRYAKASSRFTYSCNFSMTKFSDKDSDGSYQIKQLDKYKSTK